MTRPDWKTRYPRLAAFMQQEDEELLYTPDPPSGAASPGEAASEAFRTWQATVPPADERHYAPRFQEARAKRGTTLRMHRPEPGDVPHGEEDPC